MKQTTDEIRAILPNDFKMFMFEPKKTPKNWHKRATEKLKESQLVLLFDSLSGDNNPVGKHISWEVKKAEKLNKRIIVFKKDPKAENRSWYDFDYSEIDPRKPRYKTVAFEEAVSFMQKEFCWKVEKELLHNTDSANQYTDADKQLLLEQYRIMIETSEKLMERRQETVNLYTTLCTTLIAFVGASFAFENLNICALICLLSGLILLILCHNWKLSLNSYELNNGGKFKVIGALEKILPAEIFECEYKYNKMQGIRSFSSREKVLPWIFSIIGILLIIISAVLFAITFLK